MSWTRRLGFTAIGYLIGGVSTGYYLVKLRTGKDIRTSGSGSSGARNVGRSLGKSAYIVTAAVDTAKGAAIPAVVKRLGATPDEIAMASFAAVAGHVWPVQLGFRGGRGLTVAFGAILATEPRVGLIAVTIAGAILPLSRSFTTAGLAATAAAPLVAIALRRPASSIRAISCMTTVVLIGHRHIIRQTFRTGTREGLDL